MIQLSHKEFLHISSYEARQLRAASTDEAVSPNLLMSRYVKAAGFTLEEVFTLLLKSDYKTDGQAGGGKCNCSPG